MYSARKVINEAGSESILFAHKASILIKKDLLQDALTLCEEGVKRFPFYAQGHFMLARCYQAMNRQEEARAEFERTLTYMPDHLQARKALAYIHYKNKNKAAAQILLMNMALYDPMNKELNTFLHSEDLYDKIYETELPEPTDAPAEDEIPIASGEQSGDEEDDLFDLPEDIPASSFEEEDDLHFSFEGEDSQSEPDGVPDVEEAERLRDEDIRIGLDGDEPESDDAEMDLYDELDTPNRQDDFDRNSIVENIGESNGESSGDDLSQFANTEDDFSTLMDDIFQDTQEKGDEPDGGAVSDSEPEDEEAEQEMTAKEPPSAEERIPDKTESIQDTTADEPDRSDSALDFNDFIGQPDQDETADADPQPLPEDELTSADVTEAPPAPEKPTVEVDELKVEFDKKQAASLDDENVNIENILENPSLLTPTFGEILIAQKKFEDARQVFTELSKRDPENERFRKKIDFLNKILELHK